MRLPVAEQLGGGNLLQGRGFGSRSLHMWKQALLVGMMECYTGSMWLRAWYAPESEKDKRHFFSSKLDGGSRVFRTGGLGKQLPTYLAAPRSWIRLRAWTAIMIRCCDWAWQYVDRVVLAILWCPAHPPSASYRNVWEKLKASQQNIHVMGRTFEKRTIIFTYTHRES